LHPQKAKKYMLIYWLKTGIVVSVSMLTAVNNLSHYEADVDFTEVFSSGMLFFLLPFQCRLCRRLY